MSREKASLEVSGLSPEMGIVRKQKKVHSLKQVHKLKDWRKQKREFVALVNGSWSRPGALKVPLAL